jgi:predicted transcriptional regulator
MATKPHGTKSRYANCERHITRAGLSKKDAADLADVSTSSIARICKGEAVLVTTIAKLINALNKAHFSQTGQPLNLDAELTHE